MSRDEAEIRETICEIGRRLYRFGHVVANDGNISFRLDAENLLTTPTGVCKADMRPEQMVVVDPQGTVKGLGRPSSELPMHLFIYQQRPEIRAVVHAHPIYATAFATAGISLDRCVLAEIVATLGSIPVAPYGTPSTAELPESLRPFLQRHEAILLANHGAVTLGRDLWDAYFKLERVEHYARVVFVARQLGGEKALPKSEVQKLFDLRSTYGLEGLNPGCAVPATDDDEATDANAVTLTKAELDRIVEAIVADVRPYFGSRQNLHKKG